MSKHRGLSMNEQWELIDTIHVCGTPKAQPRVKAFVRGGHAGVYTPSTANGWKDSIRLAAAGLAGREVQGPVYLRTRVVLPRPKTRRRDFFVTTKPDADNLVKGIMDVLTQIRVWRDDAQIARLEIEKVYQTEGLPCGAEIEVFGVAKGYGKDT
jgi:Holliday junction resolvase RusA-like endonuclease